MDKPSEEFRNLIFGNPERFRQINDFGISLGVNVLFATLVLCAFTYLRPRNKNVYARRTRWFKDDSKRPPEIPGDATPGLAVFGALKLRWVHFIFNIPEDLILEKLGLDALMFVRTLALFVRAFIPIAIIAVGVLIPLDLIKGTTFIQKDIMVLALLTMENLEGANLSFLWVHTAAAWVFNLCVFYLIYTSYCKYIVLRQQYYNSRDYQRKISSRSLLCLHLPKTLRQDEELDRLLRHKIVADTVAPSSASIGRRVGPLAELITAHEKAVRKLEDVLAKYMKGGKLAAKRPRIVFLGRNEDAIEYWTCLIQNLEKQIEEQYARLATFKPTDFGFVSFASVTQAHKTAICLRPLEVRLATLGWALRGKNEAKGYLDGVVSSQLPEFIPAPEPKDIIWSNLSLTPAARRSRALLGTVLFLALSVLWIFPLAFIVSVTKLSSLVAVVPFLDNIAKWSPRLTVFMEQQIAPIIQTVFILALPRIFGYITKFQAARTKTSAQRAVFTKLYFFLILTNIFFFAIINVAEGAYSSVTKAMAAGIPISPKDLGIIDTVTRELLFTGNHFLSLVSVRGLLSQPLELAQAAALIGISIKRRLFASTPRQDREFIKPPPMDFAVQYAFHLFIFTVTFLFAPLVPLIAVAGLVYFVVSYHVYKYQCLYVFDTRIETGGLMWPLVVERVFVAQGIAQLAMAAVLWARGGHAEAYTMLPLVLITIGFHYYTARILKPRTRYIASVYPQDKFRIDGTEHGGDMIAETRKHVEYDESAAFSQTSLADRFMLPALARPLLTPEVQKESQHLLAQVYSGRLEDPALRSSSSSSPKCKHSRDCSIDSTTSFTSTQLAVVNSRGRLSRAATKRINNRLSRLYQRYDDDHDDDDASVIGDENNNHVKNSWNVAREAVPLDYSRVSRMFFSEDGASAHGRTSLSLSYTHEDYQRAGGETNESNSSSGTYDGMEEYDESRQEVDDDDDDHHHHQENLYYQPQHHDNLDSAAGRMYDLDDPEAHIYDRQANMNDPNAADMFDWDANADDREANNRPVAFPSPTLPGHKRSNGSVSLATLDDAKSSPFNNRPEKRQW